MPEVKTLPLEPIRCASTRSSNKFQERSIRLKLQRLEEERTVPWNLFPKSIILYISMRKNVKHPLIVHLVFSIG